MYCLLRNLFEQSECPFASIILLFANPVRPSCARRAAGLSLRAGGGPPGDEPRQYTPSPPLPLAAAFSLLGSLVIPCPSSRIPTVSSLVLTSSPGRPISRATTTPVHTHGWSGGTWPPAGAYVPDRGPSKAHLHGPALGTRLAWREDRHGHSDNRTTPAGPQRRGATLVVTNHLREAIMASR